MTTKELEISYRSKIRKLNQYGYNTDLFIFGSHHFLYEKTDIEKFVELINASAKENEYKFNRVFIYQYRKLYNCDISDRKVMMVNMDSNTVDLIMKEAYEFSK